MALYMPLGTTTAMIGYNGSFATITSMIVGTSKILYKKYYYKYN
jgi:hypothetical protein